MITIFNLGSTVVVPSLFLGKSGRRGFASIFLPDQFTVIFWTIWFFSDEGVWSILIDPSLTVQGIDNKTVKTCCTSLSNKLVPQITDWAQSSLPFMLCNTINSQFKEVHFSFLKLRVVWFKKDLCSESKNSLSERNALCWWICSLRSF